MNEEFDKRSLALAVRAALPICVGYIALGLPCGILGAAAGMSILQVALLSILMYSGSGQYMIASLFMAGVPILSLSASVTLVSSRQMLYGSALAPFFKGVRKARLIFFAATVTDESFGVNLSRFQIGKWSPFQAQIVNSTSHLTWIISCAAGALLGVWLAFDTAIASFAMTSIFLCLLLMQNFDKSRVLAAIVAVLGVVVCKLCGLSGLAILIGALLGVIAGILYTRFICPPPKKSESSSKDCVDDAIDNVAYGKANGPCEGREGAHAVE